MVGNVSQYLEITDTNRQQVKSRRSLNTQIIRVEISVNLQSSAVMPTCDSKGGGGGGVAELESCRKALWRREADLSAPGRPRSRCI